MLGIFFSGAGVGVAFLLPSPGVGGVGAAFLLPSPGIGGVGFGFLKLPHLSSSEIMFCGRTGSSVSGTATVGWTAGMSPAVVADHGMGGVREALDLCSVGAGWAAGSG